MVKSRQLSTDDINIWRKFTKNITPIEQNKPLPEFSRSLQALSSSLSPGSVKSVYQPKKAALLPDFSRRPAQTSPNMDKRNFQRLLKGKIKIDATLDLHGSNIKQAHARLGVFLTTAHKKIAVNSGYHRQRQKAKN